MKNAGKRFLGFGTSQAEKGKTYIETPRETKERLDSSEIEEHWHGRGKRKGLQAVMSARHWGFINWFESLRLKRNIFKFLGNHIKGKRVFELGFGIGRMTKELAKRAKEVEAVDPTLEMYEKAVKNLKGVNNVTLHNRKITDFSAGKKFDLVFESIVLLHILKPDELKKTVERMKNMCADNGHIFICEHVYEEGKGNGSRYSIFRKPDEYEKLFAPFKVVEKKPVRCAGDLFMMYLFKKPQKP